MEAVLFPLALAQDLAQVRQSARQSVVHLGVQSVQDRLAVDRHLQDLLAPMDSLDNQVLEI